MAELPAPTTLSPGKLKWLYTDGVQNHEVGSNFGATVDLTDVSTIRTEAGVGAPLIAGVLETRFSVVAWKIVNEDGVTLYEETFPTPFAGTITITGDQIYADSASVALTGKGTPEVGLKQGQTKFTVFVGFFIIDVWATPTTSIGSVSGDWGAVRTWLNSSTVVGCDFYGSPASWRNLLNTQINAHFQKRLGM